MRVFVQIPAFEEGPRLARVASQIVAQNPPQGVDVTYEAWVTLSPKDKSLCSTWQAAKSVDGLDVYEAPEGKLSARNAAHNHAIESGADVVVTWDADAPPLHADVLAELLAPFESDDVVAVNGAPVSPPTAVGTVVNVVGAVEDTVRPHLHGQLSAVRATAWWKAGPFDEKVDQTSVGSVRSEEEFSFYRRLRSLGRVVESKNAQVANSTRRLECRLGLRDDAYCGRIGEETFYVDDSGCGCGD